MESGSFTRMLSCHILTVVGTFVFALTCSVLAGVEDDKRISAIIGLGFGQLSLLAIWCIAGVSRARFWTSVSAVLGCYLAMSICVVIQARHIDWTFFISLAIFCLLYFFAMAAAMVVIKKRRGVSVVRLTAQSISKEFSGQYGIRDILITTSIAAIAAAAIKVLSSQDFARDLLEMLTVFGLISVSFFLMSWPIVASCLSKRWLLLAVFTMFLIVGIVLVQRPVFTSILGPGGDLGFFIFLDAPFVFAVALHSLIARWFGYRLTTIGNGGILPSRF